MSIPFQGTVDAVLKKIRRHPLYYRRYNNTLPFSVNNSYMRYARACAAKYVEGQGKSPLPSPLSTGGAMRLGGVYPAEAARASSAKITELIERGDPSVDRPKNFSDLQIRIRDPLQTIGSQLLDVFRSPVVNRELQSFFQGNYRIEWLNVYRTIPAERVASSWLWHSDSYPPRTLKLFLHLTPVRADTGATEFMNLDDTMAYRRAGYFGQYLGERYADLQEFAQVHGLPYRPFHFDAEPGDATIFDMNFFHRAVSPRQHFRDVVQFFLVPNPITWQEQLQRDGLQSLNHLGSGYPKDPRRPEH